MILLVAAPQAFFPDGAGNDNADIFRCGAASGKGCLSIGPACRSGASILMHVERFYQVCRLIA